MRILKKMAEYILRDSRHDRWIPIKESLPELSRNVVVYIDGSIDVLHRCKDGYYRDGNGACYHPSWVTHWMVLDAPGN